MNDRAKLETCVDCDRRQRGPFDLVADGDHHPLHAIRAQLCYVMPAVKNRQARSMKRSSLFLGIIQKRDWFMEPLLSRSVQHHPPMPTCTPEHDPHGLIPTALNAAEALNLTSGLASTF